MSENLRNIEKQILQDRARRLAQPILPAIRQEEEIRVLSFRCMGSTFALPLPTVSAVMKINDIMHIPRTPAHITGVIRRRGATIALVNLRRFCRSDAEGLVDEDFAILITVLWKTFAIQVEDIDGVVLLLKSTLRPVPDSYSRSIAQYLTAVTPDGTGLLDPRKLLLAEGLGTTPVEVHT
jgi:chemotaxis signal transduction protein